MGLELKSSPTSGWTRTPDYQHPGIMYRPGYNELIAYRNLLMHAEKDTYLSLKPRTPVSRNFDFRKFELNSCSFVGRSLLPCVFAAFGAFREGSGGPIP